jgi:ribosomal protein S12 methylthiotransferase accessory factor
MTFEEARIALAATGLFGPEQTVPAFTDEPKIPAFLCYPSARAATVCEVTQGVNGSGFHPDPERARLQAGAECLERLSLMNPPEDELVRGRPADIPGSIDPLVFRAHSHTQFSNFVEFERQVAGCSFRWWPATAVGTDEQVLLPAQLVFLSSIVSDEVLVRREQITTGAALGPIGTDIAFASGLLEAVERDAAMAAYLKRTSPPRIAHLAPKLQDTVDYFRRYHLEPHFLDVTTDLGIPSVVAVTVDRTGLGPAINIGTAADLTYEDAILSALYESIQTRNPRAALSEPIE